MKMTEYERVRRQAEEEALASGGMTKANVTHARRSGALICASVGLTPERVWMLTRPMRKEV